MNPTQMPSMFGVPFAQRLQLSRPQATNFDPNSPAYKKYLQDMQRFDYENPNYVDPVGSSGGGSSGGNIGGNRTRPGATQSPLNRNQSPFAITGGMVPNGSINWNRNQSA